MKQNKRTMRNKQLHTSQKNECIRKLHYATVTRDLQW
jgi:hypothetical protein